MNPLVKNQIIGGICAVIVVILACVRIFVFQVPMDPPNIDGVLMNLISVTNAVLSLVVLITAVRIMLAAKKERTFSDVLAERLDEIDLRYGDLIEPTKKFSDFDETEGTHYAIGSILDAVLTCQSNEWADIVYLEKFALSPNFAQTRKIYYYINNVNMKARAARSGDTLEVTARLLARDTAVAIQRSFSDFIIAHALQITHEEGRSVVTITVNSTKTADDAERVAKVLDYMLFLHFVLS